MDVNAAGQRWFWRNYDACMNWHEQHKVAYWKSKALALEYERNALLQYVRGYQETTKDFHGPVNSGSPQFFEMETNVNRNNSRKRRICRRDKRRKRFMTHARYNNSSCDHEDNMRLASTEEPVSLDLETGSNADSDVDHDLLEFFKQSMTHKMELRARRKASEESDWTDSSSMKKSGSVRSEEMRLLYGKNSAMIHGMETAMQLTFERNCDILNPVLWPVLPLKM
ncbi:gem-associated protein 8-like [Ischnura elegans]|uniref:gem-associated protein 8-like n=1 Tax=Ischnura elegans TaxID=197161 RepID=UPI001ED892C8|nr:gem-associated protein 8-like [Ischnura elegans]